MVLDARYDENIDTKKNKTTKQQNNQRSQQNEIMNFKNGVIQAGVDR